MWTCARPGRSVKLRTCSGFTFENILGNSVHERVGKWQRPRWIPSEATAAGPQYFAWPSSLAQVTASSCTVLLSSPFIFWRMSAALVACLEEGNEEEQRKSSVCTECQQQGCCALGVISVITENSALTGLVNKSRCRACVIETVQGWKQLRWGLVWVRVVTLFTPMPQHC